VLERPPRGYGHRQKLVEGMSPLRLTCHCTEKAGYIYSSSLKICRVAFLLLRQRRGAGLGELQRARGRSEYFATAPAHTLRARARHRHFLFPLQNYDMEFLTFPRSSSTFFSLVLPPSGCFFSREIVDIFRRVSAVTR
jgi:hypothetical protein